MWTSEVNNKFLLTPQTAIIKNIVFEILRECDKRDFVCEKKVKLKSFKFVVFGQKSDLFLLNFSL
jgi:hypothetical protein